MSRRSKQIENTNSRKWIPYVLLMPGVIILLALYGYPIILTFIQSFNKVSLLTSDMQFVGLENYKSFLSDRQIIKSLSITFKYTLITVFFKISLGFLFAYILHKDIYLKKLNRFLILIPWAIPQVAVSTIWKWMLDGNYGYINYFLQKLGIIDKSLYFLSDPKTAFYLVSFIDAWMGVPLVCMMFLAGLEQIPKVYTRRQKWMELGDLEYLKILP